METIIEEMINAMIEKLLIKIKFYIKDKDLTIYKVTELCDLSGNTIYNWYNKGAEPSLRALYSICKVLGISMSELFSESDKEVLTIKENELVKQFRTLSDDQKDLVIKLLSEIKS